MSVHENYTPRLPGSRNFSMQLHVLSIVTLLAFAILPFSFLFFSPPGTVLSQGGTDIYHEFLFSRQFGFNELRHGNLPLWNPHLFSGFPFFAGFQSALLYPLNSIFLFLPIETAINTSIVLHVFITGLFMYLWGSFRGLEPIAALLAALLLMLSGAYFPHIYAGHLSNLCTMSWAPLILLAVDGFYEKHSLAWVLLGMFAIVMQILAGHPQYVFYTGITVVLYAVMLSFVTARRGQLLLGVMGMYAGGACLGAIQLAPGIAAAAETIRGSGVPYAFVASYSFPPQNLITLLVPHFFGDMHAMPYWGRFHLWEMQLFISITGLAFCFPGALAMEKHGRRIFLAMICLLLLLAFGGSTPLLQFLYDFVPGFNKFRGSSKFIFFLSLFLILLSATGFDAVLKKKKVHRATWLVFLCGAILFAGGALFIRSSVFASESSFPIWEKLLTASAATKGNFYLRTFGISPQFLKSSALWAAWSLLNAAAALLVLSFIAFSVRMHEKIVFLFPLFAIVEILIFSNSYRAGFDVHLLQQPELAELASHLDREARVLNTRHHNLVVRYNMNGIWGYDPGVPRRYAEFMAFSQGRSPDAVSQYMDFPRNSPLYAMLRCRQVIPPAGESIQLADSKEELPRAFLVYDYEVQPGRDDLLAAMASADFDWRRKVLLETVPDPQPERTQISGRVKIREISTDELAIEVMVATPAILVITDSYSKDWRVKAAPESAQQHYTVLPANYILRAIPLQAGHHVFTMEYLPTSFVMGRWLSFFSIFAYVVLVFWCWYKKRRGKSLSFFFVPRPRTRNG